MSAPLPPPGPFRVPSVNAFVPRVIQPWIYLLMALCFQLSGGRYLGALNYMIGEEQLMREDLLMALWCNLAGMATLFPLMFRLKFRFTNKTLLRAAALGVLVCNLLIPYVNCLPLLWLLCFIEGICKLEGTFECMSTVQLWITPTRNFRVFFPVLHIFILGAMNISSWLVAYFAFGWDDWRLMHWFIAGLMLVILLFNHTCMHHFRFMPKVPLYGIDWVGYLGWVALLVQIAYLFTYGDWMNWDDSPLCFTLIGTICITFALLLYGMKVKLHPFISRKVFKFKHTLPILLIISLFEVLLSAEHVLEEVLLEEGMHLTDWGGASRYWFAVLGCYTGCFFSWWWMKIRGWGYARLGLVAAVAVMLYLLQMYFLIYPGIWLQQLYLPIFLRGFASAVMAIMLMTLLQYSTDFHTFFQCLSLFNMIHMILGGCLGAALYGEWMGRGIADAFVMHNPGINSVVMTRPDHIGVLMSPDGFGHLMEHQTVEMILTSIRTCYGWGIYGACALILIILTYDMPLRCLKPYRMIPWKQVGRRFAAPFARR